MLCSENSLYVADAMRFSWESGTVSALPTVVEIRLALRRARRDRDLTLDALSEKSGVDRAAIHKSESVAKYPSYEPQLGTVAALLAAMGITLSEFFGQFGSLKTGVVPRITDHDQQTSGNIEPKDSTTHGRSPLPPSVAPHDLDDRNALLARNTAAIHALNSTIARLADGLRESREQNATTRARKPVRAGRGRQAG